MSISVPVCHRLIDDIVKRGGQEISDRFIIKKCLNTHILINKRNIVKELVKQSGAKGEYSSFREGIPKDCTPRTIGKDEYTSKSVKKIVVDGASACQKVSKEKRKFRSLSMKNKMTDIKEQMMSTCNHTAGGRTHSSFGFRKQNKCKLLTYSIKKQEAFTVEISSKQGKEIETLRNNWIEDERDQQQKIEKNKRMQQQKQKAMAKQKLQFKKELAGNNSFTYHTNGKYMVYSPAYQRRSLENKYPSSLDISYQQNLQKIGNVMFNDQLRTFRSTNSTTNAQVTLISVPSETKQTERQEQIQQLNKEHEFSQQNRADSLYNNHNRRQTSSLEFVRTKKGICFTEPGKGNSLIDDEDSEPENLRERKKSSFSKFFTTSQGFKFSKSEKLDSNMGIEKKQQRLPCSETSKLCLPKRKHKVGFKQGKIKYANESLFYKMMMNA